MEGKLHNSVFLKISRIFRLSPWFAGFRRVTTRVPYLTTFNMAQAPEQKENKKGNLQVCVCGGGNGAHAFAGLLSSYGTFDVNWMSLYGDEAKRINKHLSKGKLKVKLTQENNKTVQGKPKLVTNDPSKALPGCDIVIFCVPAFAHGSAHPPPFSFLFPLSLVKNKPTYILFGKFQKLQFFHLTQNKTKTHIGNTYKP